MEVWIALLLVAGLFIIGCIEEVWHGEYPSASPAVVNSVIPSATPPAAFVPEEYLEDDIDKSIEELEIVG